MFNILFRFFQRVFLLALQIGILWLVLKELFARFPIPLPFLPVLVIAYFLFSYLFFPRLVHVVLFLLRRGRLPRYTHASDGVLADPVNVVLFGSQKDLVEAFQVAGWHVAEPLTLRTALAMGVAFVFNKGYLHAPFSSLYLFARKQDIGFQKMIGDSPRKRHHVRFWATNTDEELDFLNVRFWLSRRKVDHDRPVRWIGAATKDIGLGFSRFTYHFTHRIDTRVDAEREYLIHSLLSVKKIIDLKEEVPGMPVIGEYISDGKIVTAWLVPSRERAL